MFPSHAHQRIQAGLVQMLQESKIQRVAEEQVQGRMYTVLGAGHTAREKAIGQPQLYLSPPSFLYWLLRLDSALEYFALCSKHNPHSHPTGASCFG